MILSRLNGLQQQLLVEKKRRAYRRKIRGLKNSLAGPLVEFDPGLMSIRKYIPGYKNTDWHVAYASLNDVVSGGYVPEEIFYTRIEPKLNHRYFSAVYEDKASLSFLLGNDLHVGNIFFRNNGRYFDAAGGLVDFDQVEAWLEGQDDVVLKPSRVTGGGRGVVIGRGATVVGELKKSGDPVVIQEVFRQHPDIARFNPASVNTIRLMSLRVQGKIVIVSAVMRMGVAGSRIDNATRGAVAVGVMGGVLGDHARDVNFQRYEEHPTSGIRFKGEHLPHWDRIAALAVTVHNRFLEAGIVSWDIAVGEDGIPKVIEANVTEQELNGHQLLNGPVLEPYLDALLA